MAAHARMALLHRHGFQRAVILQEEEIAHNLTNITYHNNEPQLESGDEMVRIQTPWPSAQPLPQEGLSFEQNRQFVQASWIGA